MRGRRTLVIVAALLALLVAPSGRWLAGAAEPGEEQGEENPCCRAVEQTMAGKLPLADVTIGVVDRHDGKGRFMTVYGDGVGVWNGNRQFRVEPAAVKDMLDMLEKAHFCKMEDRAAEEEGDAMRMMRGISLRIGDMTKTVNQLQGGTGSKELEELATRLLDSCREKGEAGVTATSLQDGLAKLADGTLAPQVLSVACNSPQRGSAETGWVLLVHGRNATVKSHGTEAGYGGERRGRLSEEEFQSLVKELAAADLPTLPVNVYSTAYTDLSVSVLDRSRTLQARAFAGQTAETNKPAQKRFEKLRNALHALYQRVAKDEGSGAS